MPHTRGMVPTTPRQAISEREAAPYTGLSTHGLRAMRRQGRGPAYLRLGRAIRYRIVDLDAWMTAHRVEPREAAQQ